jgi:hypothetical protein
LSAGARSLLRPDGSVVVPPELAARVLRILLRDVGARLRSDDGRLSAGVHDLAWALHAAAEGVRSTQTLAPAGGKGTHSARTPGGDQAFSWHQEEGRAAAPTLGGSVLGTPVAAGASVEVSTAEAARRMGCSESYVRRLARLGLVPARRVAGVWLITTAAEAADDESEAA